MTLLQVTGLFINTGELEIPVAAGNTVQLTGVVRETYQQTQVQITNPDDIITLGTGGPLPTTVGLDPPPDEIESNAYYESLEGMLVQVEPGWAGCKSNLSVWGICHGISQARS